VTWSAAERLTRPSTGGCAEAGAAVHRQAVMTRRRDARRRRGGGDVAATGIGCLLSPERLERRDADDGHGSVAALAHALHALYADGPK
jgi:hypothetical protein